MVDERWADPLEGLSAYSIQSQWARMYLSKYHRTGRFEDGLGHPDYRYLRSTWLYDPRVYRSWYSYWDPPPGGGPPSTEPIVLTEHLQEGLDFYVYMSVSNLRVTYDVIKAEDKFYLYSPCEELDIKIPCEIIDPSDSKVPGHPYGFPQEITNDLKQHQFFYQWGSTWWNVVDLPIFLRVKPEDLEDLKTALENGEASGANTFILGLTHTFPKKEKIERVQVGTTTYLRVIEDNERFSTSIDRFFTLMKELPKTIRILVASDIHVEEKADTLDNAAAGLGDSSIGADPRYCNRNMQARRLAQEALELWKKGKIDYAVFLGDLIDYAWKDSNVLNLNLYPNRGFAQTENSEGIEIGIPYALGEFGQELPALLGEGQIQEAGDWYEVLEEVLLGNEATEYVPGGRTLFIGEGAGDNDNIAKVYEVEARLRDYDNSESWELSNWSEFEEIFKPMMNCVTTYLVPGNHDRYIFGPDLLGILEDPYNAFIKTIIDDILENEPGLEGYITNVKFALIKLLTRGNHDAAVKIARSGAGIPDWEEVEFYTERGLSINQGEKYDEDYRELTSTNPSVDLNYRAFLMAFHSPGVLAGLMKVASGFSLPTGGIFTGIGAGSVELPYANRDNVRTDLRLGFFDNGPNWDTLQDATPRTRGFYWEKKREEAPPIANFRMWRNSPENLIIFMHAPPICHYGAHGGPPLELVNLSLEFPQTFVHNFEEFLRILHPYCATNYAPYTVEHKNPLLVLAGHTHRRHTYSVLGTDSNVVMYKYWRGNSLIDDLHSKYATDGWEGAYKWWVQPEQSLSLELVNRDTGRALCVHTGCVGALPCHDYDEENSDPIEPGDDSFTPFHEQQGYYIIEIVHGIVTSIEWRSLWYKD